LEGGFCQGIESDRLSGQSDASSAFTDLKPYDQPVLVNNNPSDKLCEGIAISFEGQSAGRCSILLGGEMFFQRFLR